MAVLPPLMQHLCHKYKSFKCTVYDPLCYLNPIRTIHSNFLWDACFAFTCHSLLDKPLFQLHLLTESFFKNTQEPRKNLHCETKLLLFLR